MSNVYSIEPPTTAKVILKTNFGNLDIELWTKEAPRACRNFIQLSIEKYYNNNVFFRIIKGFIIQTGDPINSGKGGESIWKKDFQDEFHSRLKFNHRGIVAMANKNSPNTNSSQFFITMEKCPWLDKKHTIFGKIAGDTFFNALTISELSVNKHHFPITDTLPIIIDTEVIINPFLDITLRERQIEKNSNETHIERQVKQSEKKQNAHYLISFYDDEINNEQKQIKPIEELVDPDYSDIQKNKEIVFEVNDDNNISINDDEESISVEEGYIPEDMQKVEIGDSKKEILKLKQEIQTMKQKANLSSNELFKDSLIQNSKITPLQRHNEKYLQLKTKRTNIKEAINKLDKFKANLSKGKQKSNHWMNNKLKFHIDSQKAYAIDNAKEIEKRNHRINI